MAVKEQRQLSLFGTKISFSTPPDEEEDRPELAKSSEDGQGSNAEEFSSLSASTSGSDDEKAKKNKSCNENSEVLPVSNSGAGDRRSSRGTLRRPDKPVPCPRCNSLDTKFCYFNNYNVNQPRHFCKNCQRYWTAGGTLRNVPVGAGRRKNKNSRGGAEAGLSSKAGEAHQLEPAAQPPDKKMSRCSRALPRKNPTTPPCSKEAAVSGTSEASSNDSRDDSTCGSSVSNPGTTQEGIREGNVQQVGWPLGSNGAPAAGPPGGFWQGFVWPGPPVWCPAGWNSAWNTPWGNLAATAASAAAKAIAENVGSLQSALGKHLRDEAENRGPIWAPKTLRIDAQGGCGSSFLGDIGAGNNKVESISTGGMFKAFPSSSPGSNKSPPIAEASEKLGQPELDEKHEAEEKQPSGG